MKLLCKITTSRDKRFHKPLPGYVSFFRKKSNDEVKLYVYRAKRQDMYTLKPSMIKNLHEKFKKQGKATIELSDVTIMISEANPKELEKFIHLIKAIARGQTDIALECEDNGQIVNAQKNLKLKEIINDYRDYPKKEGFSQSLRELTIHTFKLRSVDIRWFNLRYLTVLDLSNNKLSMMDDFDWHKFNQISKLESLTTLILDNNGFTYLPPKFVQAIPKSLEYLSLRCNQLTYLPDELCDLKQLICFTAENNPLVELPGDFFYYCERLQSVNVGQTKIQSHPSLLRNYRLQDFESSAIGQSFTIPLTFQPGVGTLFGFASAKIYDKRDFYSLPYNLRIRMRQELFRCDQCRDLYPNECKKSLIYQPIPTSAIAGRASARQGTNMFVLLMDSTCGECIRRTSLMEVD